MKKSVFLASSAMAGLLAAGFGTVPMAFAQQAQSDGNSQSLETVVVTAEKKTERLLDAPVPVTVLNGDDLAANNQTGLEDLLGAVPGLTVSKGGGFSGGAMLEIRGLGTSQYTNGSPPTVGYMIDGVPYGPSEVIQIGNTNPGIPDIDPSDIERIEVLKGPQGTLYGADSIGGLLNIVTKSPSTAGFSGHVQALEEVVPDGGMGYALRAAANIPLSDDMAVRVSAFDRLDPGYIGNATTGQKNANSADVYGTHMSLLYQPLDYLSIKLSALIQDNISHGPSVINVDQYLKPQFDSLEYTELPGTGRNNYLTEAYSGVVNTSLWGIDIVSTTGWNVQKNTRDPDFTGFFGAYIDGSPSVGASPSPFSGTAPNGAAFPSSWTNDKFTQEIRFSSSYSHWIDWLVGGFYTHEANDGYTLINAVNPANGAYRGTFYYETTGTNGDPQTTLAEESLFGNVTAHITDEFNVQVGGRESWYQQVFNFMDYGPGYIDFGGTATADPPPPVSGSDHAFTWLVTPQYKISPDLMVYARLATGYQIGGTNDPGSPNPIFGPSNTTNYEIGTKGALADGKIVFDISAYHIDWKNMQVSVFSGFGGYIVNVGRARSQGVEASIQARPVDGLHITAAGSYNDARLATDFPPTASVTAPAGTQLPYSTPYSGSLTADWEAIHLQDVTGFVGATLSYIGKRPGEFDGNLGYARLNFPGFTTLNTHIGARADTWEASLYINNLTNTRGFIGGGGDFGASGNTGGYVAQLIQPRTIGLSLTKDF